VLLEALGQCLTTVRSHLQARIEGKFTLIYEKKNGVDKMEEKINNIILVLL
jgi:hypothetical protein